MSNYSKRTRVFGVCAQIYGVPLGGSQRQCLKYKCFWRPAQTPWHLRPNLGHISNWRRQSRTLTIHNKYKSFLLLFQRQRVSNYSRSWVFKLAFTTHYWFLSRKFVNIELYGSEPLKYLFLNAWTTYWVASEKSLKTTVLDNAFHLLKLYFI